MHICSYVCRLRANIRVSEVCEMHICSYVCKNFNHIRMSYLKVYNFIIPKILHTYE